MIRATAIILIGVIFVGAVVPTRIGSIALFRSTKRGQLIAGIRKLAGKHLVLYTDLPAGPEVDSLPAVFDQAVPLWAAYFGVDPAKTADWQVRAYLDRRPREVRGARIDAGGQRRSCTDMRRVRTCGCSISRPITIAGICLLHEGTHAFMTKFLGGCGPGWYMEGHGRAVGDASVGSREQGAGSRE